MPTYTYETTDPRRPIRRFETTQGIRDDPLSKDPATGEPVRRVVSLGYQIHVPGKSTGPSVGSVGGE
jgi:predicted nucleic acid-binding Zn ribbon protein